MPTANRRVATYLPSDLDDRFKSFIADRNLKGESSALIVILSEFFGVAHPVSQKVDYSGFVSIEQFQELVDKVSALTELIEKSGLDSSLPSESPSKKSQIAESLERVEELISESIEKVEALISVEDEPASDISAITPGQMDLLGLSKPVESDSESQSSLESEFVSSPLSMTEKELASRLGLSNPKSIANKRNLTKENPQEFAQWSMSRDPEGRAWIYDSLKKVYITQDSPDFQDF